MNRLIVFILAIGLNSITESFTLKNQSVCGTDKDCKANQYCDFTSQNRKFNIVENRKKSDDSENQDNHLKEGICLNRSKKATISPKFMNKIEQRQSNRGCSFDWSCSSGEECTWSFICQCLENHVPEVSGQPGCIHICNKSETEACGPDGKCIVESGYYYTCECPENHRHDKDGKCELICGNPGICGTNGQCKIGENNDYICECPAGTLKSNVLIPSSKCIDITKCDDVCKRGTCSTEGSGDTFSCQCDPGMFFNYKTLDCENFNICQLPHNICGDNGNCIDEYPGYRCDCGIGFHNQDGDKKKPCLKNSNECIEKPDICGPYSKCVQKPNSYECECLENFIKDENDPTQCILDICYKIDCNSHKTCDYTGRYIKCECSPGYVPSESDPHICVEKTT